MNAFYTGLWLSLLTPRTQFFTIRNSQPVKIIYNLYLHRISENLLMISQNFRLFVVITFNTSSTVYHDADVSASKNHLYLLYLYLSFLLTQNVRVRVNFGSRPFAYAAGHRHRAAAELVSDSAEELRSVFEMMPFAFEFEDEEAESSSVAAPSPPSGNVSGNLSHASLAPTASSQESSNEGKEDC